MCSFSIVRASAETTSLPFSPLTLRPELPTANPRDRALSGDHQFTPPAFPGDAVSGWARTAEGPPWLWCIDVLAPNVVTSLWFQAGCGSQAVHGLVGSSRTARA